MDNKKIIITIGRQYGSGGRAIADILGKKLGIPVYNNELLTKAAEKSGFSASLFKQSDEKKRFFGLGSIFGSNRYGNFTKNVLSDSELFRLQSETIKDIADQGSAIFVGRASDYVLREMDCCFDVFITSPLEIRKQRVAERRTLSLEDAEARIERKDKSRKEYYDFFCFGDKWGQAANYDLCIDSSILGEEGTADLIISILEKTQRL